MDLQTYDKGQSFPGLPVLYTIKTETNDLIFNLCEKYVDELTGLIKEKILIYEKPDKSILQEIKDTFLFILIDNVTRVMKSHRFDPNLLQGKNPLKKLKSKKLCLLIGDKKIDFPFHYTVIVYPYIKPQDSKLRRDYEQMVHLALRNIFSIPIYLISLSFYESIRKKNKISKVIDNLWEDLKYLSGNIPYSDDKWRFLHQLKLSYTNVRNSTLKVTYGNLSKELTKIRKTINESRIAETTLKESLRNKYKVDIDLKTGRIYEVGSGNTIIFPNSDLSD